MRKAQRNQIEFDRLKKAAADARLGNSIGNSMRDKEFHVPNSIGIGGTVRSLKMNDQPAQLDQTNSSDFDEVNNRTMDYDSAS